jgi:hypothetical protein
VIVEHRQVAQLQSAAGDGGHLHILLNEAMVEDVKHLVVLEISLGKCDP